VFDFPTTGKGSQGQCPGCESGWPDDVSGILGTLLAEHRHGAVEVPTTTGCSDLHEVGRNKLPEPGLVGSACSSKQLSARSTSDYRQSPSLTLCG